VVFGGDGYSSEWHAMAVEERGLRNIPTTADALPAFLDESVIGLFERTGVLSPLELESRYEVYSEQYILSIGVEAKLTAEIAKTMLYPAAMSYVSELVGSISGAASLGIEFEPTQVKIIAGEANALIAAVAALESALAFDEFATTEEHMQYCAGTLRVLMDDVRSHADVLETEVADGYWPLPKYREMLFLR
jgi:glutamine synthetase